MCGILVHIACEPKGRLDRAAFERLNQMHVHRGPDSGGIYQNAEASLGIRRLSIVDLKGGDQPIFSDDNRYAIVFNGEIYNYKELREDFISRGHRFRTHSDTEVVLRGIIEDGPKFLERLNGMFAFAIWDSREHRLFVARDRLGVKPLYTAANAPCIMFSSEMTAIARSGLFELNLNERALSDYLDYWYVCEPKTIFNAIVQFPPAHYGIWENGHLTQHCYWQMPSREHRDLNYDHAVEEIEDLLNDAVKLRIPQEVPFGTFLSGGIDSGLITAMASRSFRQRMKAFSIGFKEESYSEIPEAQNTAALNNVELITTEIAAMTGDQLETIIQAFDEPLGNASYVPTYLLAKLASQHVKVVLTGDGGDELFGGYPTYQAPYFQNMYRQTPRPLVRMAQWGVGRLPVSHKRISLDFRLKQFMKGADLSYDRAHMTWRQVTPVDVQRSLFQPEVVRRLNGYDPFSVAQGYFASAKDHNLRNQLMYVDMNTYLLNDHLRKVDRMTMAHSLEARLPLMDYRLVELVMSMPSEYKVTFWQTKRILKQIAQSYLPQRVIDGKKKGLTSPIAGWIAGGLKGYIHDVLNGGIVAELFQPSAVKALLDEHDRKVKDHSRVIWSLLTLQVWAKKYKTAVTAVH